MRIIVVGGTGTIGTAVVAALGETHDVVAVGHSSGQQQVDIASRQSIERMYDEIGAFDALVSTAGSAAWKPLAELTDEDFRFSLSHKLMGQANLVRIGMGRVGDGGSFTLTSGILAQQPMAGSAAVSLVNAGLEGFVRAAALEAPRSVRINVVSPPWVSETLEEMGQDPSGGMPAAGVARAYVRAVEGSMTGKVIDAGEVVG